ncbi:MAG: endonuclease [Clostridia bacterium]|nr:endonuclease [Clostridia bacterium]
MKATTTKLLAIIMAILIVISSLSITVAAAQPTTYSKQSNSGTRNEVCTSLSGTSASSYYTGDYTYAELKSSTDIHGDLHDLMKDTHTKITTYNDCKTMVWKVDCEQNDTSHATTLYTSHSMSSGEWDGVWSCNREHVWPQSLGGNNTSGGGADLHHIRPAEASVNSSRGISFTAR